LERKWLAQVLVGLQVMRSGHLTMGLPMQGHMVLGSWQKTRLAMTAQPPRDASPYYFNIITYNKNSIIYTTTDNIYNTNNTIFCSNSFNYNKN
jgi:hypothetical protein